MKSRILRVNKLNTKFQKKPFRRTHNNSAQKVPEVPSLWISANFLNLSCITLAGSKDYFPVSVTTHAGLYPFQGRNLISHVQLPLFVLLNKKRSEFSSTKKIHFTPSICNLEIDAVYLWKLFEIWNSRLVRNTKRKTAETHWTACVLCQLCCCLLCVVWH